MVILQTWHCLTDGVLGNLMGGICRLDGSVEFRILFGHNGLENGLLDDSGCTR